MDSLTTLVSVLTPMFAGFLIRLPQRFMPLLDKMLSVLVYAVLFFIGVSVSHVENLAALLDDILTAAVLLFACTVVMNILVLVQLGRLMPWQAAGGGKRAAVGLSGSIRQLGCAALGFAFGKTYGADMSSENLGMYCLMLLLLLIGIQLKSSGISLKQVLLNRAGIRLSVWFMLSSMAGGLLFAALMPDVSWSQGLTLASGFGWYSLSSLVVTEAYGAVWGSVALLNDLAREFFALASIPVLMRRHPYAAVGVGGATSMDFTLPVIRAAGGLEIVPLAVSFGVVVNVAAPVLMVVFSAFG